MHTPTVSIVIPIYKTEKYLNNCIQSIISQTYQDFELILIDDGSPDKCPQICDEWQKKDTRIKVIHKENEGVSAARNIGIDNANGTYLLFVDSDDYIKANTLECMLNNAGSDIDMVMGSVEMRNTENDFLYAKINDNRTIDIEDFAKNINVYDNKCDVRTSCNKLFKTETIKKHNIRFDRGLKIGEDAVFVLTYVDKIRRIKMISDVLYIYLLHDVQTTNTYAVNLLEQLLIVNKHFESLSKNHLEKNEIYNMNDSYYRSFSIAVNCIENVFRNNVPKKEKIAEIKMVFSDDGVKEMLLYYKAETIIRKVILQVFKTRNCNIIYSCLYLIIKIKRFKKR